ncbi:MAG: S41 family peptidase [Gemmatimonadota bacterium]|nr:S41 family peptidase [Gemmatimonadota bacterium]MDE3215816.1 S41 family peptidase [Gemmatimonadota bacterium]
MRRSRKFAVALALLAPIVAGGFILQAQSPNAGSLLLDQVLSLVTNRYVDTLPAGDVYEKAARGLVDQLNDPYSQLFSPEELSTFNKNTGGQYGGIGMQIESQNGVVTISKVFPNTPAEEAGVMEGDQILWVDSLSTRGWSLSRTSDYLTGTPGTKVKVKFGRPGVSQLITVNFTRAVIHVPAVPYAIMLPNKIGYIPLLQFNETAAQDVETAAKALQAQGARGLILDERGNPGGILDQSLALSGLFLKRGEEIVSVRTRTGPPMVDSTTSAPVFGAIPLVVLTDGGTASAAEIVAGALQDHDRALIVGQTSFGKGLVQSVYELDGGYALKLTTGKWYTPSGRSIQRERKFVNGHFLPVAPDSAESEESKKDRPVFYSDDRRPVYGGGGITPDVIVPDDTLTTAEQSLAKALAPKSQEVYVTLYRFALDLSHRVKRGFKYDPAWRGEFIRQLDSAGVDVEPSLYAQAPQYLDQLIEDRLSRFVEGDSTAKRRELPYDAPLARALQLLNEAKSQQNLFAVAGAALPAASPKKP